LSLRFSGSRFLPRSVRTRHSSWKQADSQRSGDLGHSRFTRSAMKASPALVPRQARSDLFGRTNQPCPQRMGKQGPETRGKPTFCGNKGPPAGKNKGHPHSAGLVIRSQLNCVCPAIPGSRSCLAPSDPPQLLETGLYRKRSGDARPYSPDFRYRNESESALVRMTSRADSLRAHNQPWSAAGSPLRRDSRRARGRLNTPPELTAHARQHQPRRFEPDRGSRIGAQVLGDLCPLVCCNCRPVQSSTSR